MCDAAQASNANSDSATAAATIPAQNINRVDLGSSRQDIALQV